MEETVLDDLKYIHERDAQDALGVAEKQWQQLDYDYKVDLKPAGEIRNIILAGMGGSALPGVFLPSLVKLKVPFEVVRNYDVPNYVGPGTLFISSSYSGNTEETLSALKEAEKLGAQVITVAAGGKLLEYSKQKNYPIFQIPTGIQPRMSSFYFLAAFVQLFESLELTESSSGSLKEAAKWLSEQSKKWLPTVATKNNQAKQIAQELMGRTVVVYSGPKLFPAANKWKICFNENAKNLAWANRYPEFNHNEF